MLTKLDLHINEVQLGRADIIGDLTPAQYDVIRSDLRQSGLELIDDPKDVLIDKIKKAIKELVSDSDEPLAVNLSAYLSGRLYHNYTYMALVFSENNGHSVERFYIECKIERVKEWLIATDHSLTDISYKMHYSSVAHLSSQFKKVTGCTPSHYRRLHR